MSTAHTLMEIDNTAPWRDQHARVAVRVSCAAVYDGVVIWAEYDFGESVLSSEPKPGTPDGNFQALFVESDAQHVHIAEGDSVGIEAKLYLSNGQAIMEILGMCPLVGEASNKEVS